MDTWLHSQSTFANKKLSWLPSDTHELWQENMKNKKHKEYLQTQGWDKEDSIDYKFNERGFRTHRFKSQTNIITLGCSFTVGTGLELDQVWPSLLEQHLDITVNNLGVFGLSLDGCYRLLRYYLAELKPCAVVLCEPPNLRFEIYGNDHFRTIQHHLTDYGDWPKAWFSNDYNLEVHREKNLAALKVLCGDIPFYTFPLILYYDDARDFMHCGPISHKKAFEQFVQKNDLTKIARWNKYI
jgi:hypothetical protein